MDLRVLLDGPVLRISQNPNQGVDQLIVYKFGKHEVRGWGFRTMITGAGGCDLPAIVGVNKLNVRAFDKFVSSNIMRLAPNSTVITGWFFKNILK
jgi:hypothetical protein